MSNAAVEKATGRTWAEWVAILDKAGAAKMDHGPITAIVAKHDAGNWWTQMVTVGYERIRGLRGRGQRRSGAWEAAKNRTFNVPVETLFSAFPGDLETCEARRARLREARDHVRVVAKLSGAGAAPSPPRCTTGKSQQPSSRIAEPDFVLMSSIATGTLNRYLNSLSKLRQIPIDASAERGYNGGLSLSKSPTPRCSPAGRCPS